MTYGSPRELEPMDLEILRQVGDEGVHGLHVGKVYRLEDGEELPERLVRFLVENGYLDIGPPKDPEVEEGSVMITLTLAGEDALSGT